ncbi:MAG: hypothetical protein FAF03_04150 [Epsilonproteobacteria bacterium]|nr:hypothetical protein [Campylobacterota bacterium]
MMVTFISQCEKNALKGIRERAETQQRAYAETREARIELYKSVTADARELREELEQNSIELSRKYTTVADQSSELINRAKEITQESENSVRLSNELDKTVTARERIANRVKQFVDRVKQFGTNIKDKFQSVFSKSEELTREVGESIKKIEMKNADEILKISEKLTSNQNIEREYNYPRMR